MLTISGRQQRKQKATTDALKHAFIDLIIENRSAEPITVSEITDRADFNRGTFYIHYKDKHQLMNELYLDAAAGLRQALRSPYRHMHKVVLDGIVPSTRLIFEHIESNKTLFSALDLISTQPGLYERLEQMFWQLFTEEIMLERELPSADTEYEIFLSYQLHATLGVIKYWIKGNFKYSAEFMCGQLTSFYSHKVTAMLIKGSMQ